MGPVFEPSHSGSRISTLNHYSILNLPLQGIEEQKWDLKLQTLHLEIRGASKGDGEEALK